MLDDTKQYDKVEQLQEDGHTVWSISRLNSYNTCPHGYYLTYEAPDADRGIQNIYSHAGTIIHDALEDLHNDPDLSEREVLQGAMTQIMLDKMMDSTLQFPKLSNGKNTIEDNWVNAMTHFSKNFNRVDGEIATEKLFCMEIIPDVYIRGYIDAIVKTPDGEIHVLDWKTSSRFSGQKRLEAGRQLVLYKMAVEEVFGLKVDKVGWHMLKYARAHYPNGSKMVDRGKWVEQVSKQIDELLAPFYDNELTRTMVIAECVKNNSIETLPASIQKQVWLEPLVEYYDVTPELENELKHYVRQVVYNIKHDQDFFPVNIDYSTSFFCMNLCSQREKCNAFQTWQRKNK